ncbi:hypothetical protein [Amycolatopsis sp. NPDC051071]|uniref:hypothetical protein n=1 Tax=Amycolatopsis sp. NPDC051071 TaxID=3154637 RepID=UPI003412F5F1
MSRGQTRPVSEQPDTGWGIGMGKGGYQALETAGLVITGFCAQAVIRGLFNRDTELLWGAVAWAPGGFTGQLVLLGCIALVGLVLTGWAHARRKPAEDQ